MSNRTVGFTGHMTPEDELLWLAAIVDSSDDAIIGISLEGIILTWNAGATRLYGYTRDEVLGRPISLLVPEDHCDETKRILRKIDRGERVPPFDTLRRRKDGCRLNVSVTVSPLFDAEGKLVGASSIARDITEQKRAEAALRESDDRFETFMAEMPAMVFIKDSESRLLYANEMLKELFGWGDEIGRHTSELLPPDLAEAMIRDDRRVLEQGPEVIHERVLDVHGNVHYAETRKFPFRSSRGDLLLGGITIDETLRRKAEEALRESEDRFRLLLDSAAESIYGIDLDGNCTFCNEACLRQLGYGSKDELLGRDMHAQIHHSHRDGTPFGVEQCQIFKAFRAGSRSHVVDEVLWRADGTFFDAEYWSYPQLRDGQLVGAVVTFLDITERRRAEELLATQNQRLASILDGTNVGTWEWNVQTGETTYNERWAEIVGYTLEELAPASIDTWLTLVHPEDASRSADILERHFRGELERYECEARMRRKDGQWVWVLDRGKVASWTDDGLPLFMFGTHQDITERKRAEAEREKLVEDLRAALAQVRTLGGLIPICSSCKKIRDDRGYWNILEAYISEHAHVTFSHGICPECEARLFAEYLDT